MNQTDCWHVSGNRGGGAEMTLSYSADRWEVIWSWWLSQDRLIRLIRKMCLVWDGDSFSLIQPSYSYPMSLSVLWNIC